MIKLQSDRIRNGLFKRLLLAAWSSSEGRKGDAGRQHGWTFFPKWHVPLFGRATRHKPPGGALVVPQYLSDSPGTPGTPRRPDTSLPTFKRRDGAKGAPAPTSVLTLRLCPASPAPVCLICNPCPSLPAGIPPAPLASGSSHQECACGSLPVPSRKTCCLLPSRRPLRPPSLALQGHPDSGTGDGSCPQKHQSRNTTCGTSQLRQWLCEYDLKTCPQQPQRIRTAPILQVFLQ